MSDGTIERLGADVVHFLVQSAFFTNVPSIYHPHDLQHRHLPQFFTPAEIERREAWYRALCEQARVVAVASEWTKRDVQEAYGLPADKVRVIPFAPPTDAYALPSADVAGELRARLGVRGSYLLYPAQTWPHKNHLRLLEAMASLRARGLDVRLVAPGRQNEHFPELEAAAARLGLVEAVRWLGFVSTEELGALYAGARGVVIPTLFEAASAPLWEAFRSGIPAACSNVTSLPEQAGDAAIVFDPHDVASIEKAIVVLWSDETVRARLVDLGHRQVSELSWTRSAELFRAEYRRIAHPQATG